MFFKNSESSANPCIVALCDWIMSFQQCVKMKLVYWIVYIRTVFLNCLTENCPLRLLSFITSLMKRSISNDQYIKQPSIRLSWNQNTVCLSELSYLFLRKTIELHHLLHAIASIHNDVGVCWRKPGQTGWKYTVLSLLNKHHNHVITLSFTVVDFSIQSNLH